MYAPRMIILIGVVLAAICCDCQAGRAATKNDAIVSSDPSLQRCRKALDGVDAWLKSSPSRNDWESYLQLAEVRGVLNKTQEIDPSTRREILTKTIRRLSVPAAELDFLPLIALREALVSLVNTHDRLTVDQLPAMARSLPPTFRLYSAAEIDQSRKSLQQELKELDANLTTMGQNGTGWKEYLEWDHWYPGLSKGKRFEVPLLISIYKNLHSGYPGLESSPFARPRAAFDCLLRRELTADTTEVQGNIEAHCERLAQLLELLARDLPQDWDAKQAEALAWFDLCGQHPEVVADLRERISRPNVVLHVSADLLNAALRREFDKTSAVHDVILGARVSGQAHTVATTESHLVPDPQRGLLELLVRGTCSSRTTSNAGLVDVHSRSRTPFVGRALVNFDDAGAHLSSFNFKAETQSTPLGFTNKARPLFQRLVGRLANSQIQQQLPQADWTSARHAEIKLTGVFNAEAKARLDRLNENWWKKVRQPLSKVGEFPDGLRFSTTTDFLQVSAREANLFQLASPQEPPAIEGHPMLAMRIHQSSLNNLFAGLWGGRTFEEQELRSRMIYVANRLSERLGGDKLTAPWSGRLAENQPIEFKFENNGFEVRIRNQSFNFAQAEQGEIDMAADYQFHRDGTNLVAMRDGAARLHFPELIVNVGEKLTGNARNTQAALQLALERLFPEELIFEGLLPLPNALAASGPLELTGYRCEDGWLSLDWSKPKRTTVARR